MKVAIGFSTSDWWVSRVIRWFTGAKVSHTFITFEDPASPLGTEVYEAAWCGFRMSTLGKLRSGSTRVVQFVPVELEPTSALAMCRAWLETPYDYLGLVGEAWVQFGRLFGQRWHNPSAGVHHMFCSEAATYLLQMSAGASDLKVKVAGLDPRATSPADLLEVLS